MYFVCNSILFYKNQNNIWSSIQEHNVHWLHLSFLGSSDNTARLWSVLGEVRREYSGYQKTISAVAFRDVAYPASGDGRYHEIQGNMLREMYLIVTIKVRYKWVF